jgi:sortase (surface protein transpeptidase)
MSFLVCTIFIAGLSSPVIAATSHPKGTVHIGPSAGKTGSARGVVFKTPAGWPRVMYIPKIAVSAPVESLAFNRSNDAHAPYKWGDVAWYDRGSKPGDSGNAAIFGHVDSTCCPAVFYQIQRLRAGDIVEVKYKSGPTLKFRVMWQQTYPNDHLPLKFIFGTFSGPRALSLVTCTGAFQLSSGYDHKRVVYARLILPNGKLG